MGMAETRRQLCGVGSFLPPLHGFRDGTQGFRLESLPVEPPALRHFQRTGNGNPALTIPRLSLYTGFLPRNVADFTSVAVVHKGCSLEPRIFLTTTATLSLRSLAGVSIQAQVEGPCSAYNRAVETERNPFAGRGTRHESHGLRTPSAGFHKQRQDLPFNL